MATIVGEEVGRIERRRPRRKSLFIALGAGVATLTAAVGLSLVSSGDNETSAARQAVGDIRVGDIDPNTLPGGDYLREKGLPPLVAPTANDPEKLAEQLYANLANSYTHAYDRRASQIYALGFWGGEGDTTTHAIYKDPVDGWVRYTRDFPGSRIDYSGFTTVSDNFDQVPSTGEREMVVKVDSLTQIPGQPSISGSTVATIDLTPATWTLTDDQGNILGTLPVNLVDKKEG